MDAAFRRLSKVAASTNLPGIEPGTSYGTPALKVRGKLLVRVKDSETLVFMCPHDEKSVLMEADPAVLLRLAAATDKTIAARIEAAWRMQTAVPARRRRQT